MKLSSTLLLELGFYTNDFALFFFRHLKRSILRTKYDNKDNMDVKNVNFISAFFQNFRTIQVLGYFLAFFEFVEKRFYIT